jgi:SagB-type dehydrogenase family enzyme
VFNVGQPYLKKFAPRRLGAAVQLDNTLAEVFHENTKLTPLTSRAYGMRIAQVGQSPILQALFEQPYKVYSLMDQEELPKKPPQTELERCILARRSERNYTGEPITREELSRLLYYSYGLTGPGRYRTVASGGALYPLEIYFFALNVEGLEKGIYHYNIEQHCLDAIERRDRVKELKECVYFDTIDVDRTAVVVVITAVFQRVTMKYLDRGYRLILIEAGEVTQNMSLLAQSMGLGSCALGGFQDDNLSRLLGVNGVDEAPLVPLTFGRLPQRE